MEQPTKIPIICGKDGFFVVVSEIAAAEPILNDYRFYLKSGAKLQTEESENINIRGQLGLYFDGEWKTP